MATLLLRLIGPMQSWGTTSRFDHRDTAKEPSKSGVLGLVAAALGIDREDWQSLEPLTHARMGVRHDRSGVPKRDYQTARDITSADRTKIHPTAVTVRDYLADAAFLVGLELEDESLLRRADAALRNPAWPIWLGRKSYVPSEPVWLKDGVQSSTVRPVLENWPWLSHLRRGEARPSSLLASFESEYDSGLLKMDQPLSSFAERRFGSRNVRSVWIPFPEVTPNAAL
jgi:CRISPR system Cascade subunit CasD